MTRLAHAWDTFRGNDVENPEPRGWARLPLASKVAFSLAAACLTGALAVILGNGDIRAGYQNEQGRTAYALSFLAIQLGVLFAACFVSFDHAHPYARRWRQLAARLDPATLLRETTVSAFISLAGRHNGLLDRRDAMLAMAGKQIEISRADVQRQQFMGRHWELLGSPEAQEAKLFTKLPPAPAQMNDKELVRFLTGIADLPSFERKSTAEIHARQGELRDELKRLRDERRNLRRAQLIPRTTPESVSADSEQTTVKVGATEIATEAPDPAKVKANGTSKTGRPSR